MAGLEQVFSMIPMGVLNKFSRPLGLMNQLDHDFKSTTGLTLTQALRRAGIKQEFIDKIPWMYHSNKDVFERLVAEIKNSGGLDQQTIYETRLLLKKHGINVAEGQFRHTAKLIRNRLAKKQDRTPGQQLLFAGLNSYLRDLEA